MKTLLALILMTALSACGINVKSPTSLGGPASQSATTTSSTASATPSPTIEPIKPVSKTFEYPQPNGAYIKVVCSHASDIKLKYELTATNLGSGTYSLGAPQRGGTGSIEPNGSIPYVAMENVGVDEIVSITFSTTHLKNFTESLRYRGCTKV